MPGAQTLQLATPRAKIVRAVAECSEETAIVPWHTNRVVWLTPFNAHHLAAGRRPNLGPSPRQFDLVSAQFIHLPGPAREALHRRLGASVRPGGTLLIVGHHPSDLETSMGRPRMRDFFWTPDEVAATLSPNEWQPVVVAAPERQALDPEGREVTIRDAVLRAVRRQ